MVATKVKAIVKDKLDINAEIKFKKPLLGDVKRNYSDTTKAQNMLCWKSETNIDEGLIETLCLELENLESKKSIFVTKIYIRSLRLYTWHL